jgi:hypothetical protein
MRDFLFLIYFAMMGVIGLFFFGIMFLGMVLYYPIWRLMNYKKTTNNS